MYTLDDIYEMGESVALDAIIEHLTVCAPFTNENQALIAIALILRDMLDDIQALKEA